LSKEQLDRFLARLGEDSSLRVECGSGRLSADRLVAVAADHGFQFTSEELQSQARPLSDDEWSKAARRFEGNHSDSYILFLEEAPMSKEALTAFFKKMADDESLQRKLVEFAAAQGFEFSAEELSDSDLDSVAGGLLNLSSLSTIDGKIESLIDHKVTEISDSNVQDLTSVKLDNLNI